MLFLVIALFALSGVLLALWLLRGKQIRALQADKAAQQQQLQTLADQATRRKQALQKLGGKQLVAERYVLEQEIGSGGYGVVFRARDLLSDRPVAVKVFRPTPGNDGPEAVARFKREIATGHKVRHPNVAQVLDGGSSDEGVIFLVMELLRGRSLRQELLARGRLPAAEARAIAMAVLRALAAAHAVGVVHRDVKPDNVFVTPDGVKVLDFGVASVTPAEGDTTAMRALTATGQMVGTPGYAAPERIDFAAYDGRADVYATGVMLFEILTARLPFDVKPNDKLAVMMAHLEQPAIPLRQVDAAQSAELEAFLARCLSKTPEQRPSAAEAADMLQALR